MRVVIVYKDGRRVVVPHPTLKAAKATLEKAARLPNVQSAMLLGGKA